jgi:hypothetical protein
VQIFFGGHTQKVIFQFFDIFRVECLLQPQVGALHFRSLKQYFYNLYHDPNPISNNFMSGGGEIKYSAILLLAAFFMAQWYLARLCQVFKLPTIPVEIGVGLIFGPHGFDLISEFSHDYSPLKLLGFIGVGFVIFESGMHLNVSKVFNWEVGPHVVIVALMGTLLPICAGIGVTTAMGGDAYPVCDFISCNIYIFC